MGLLNSKANNNKNNNMECYDLNEYNNMVNNATAFDFNNYNNNDNANDMFCMQCQNFGTPCTCVEATEYLPCCQNEQEIFEEPTQFQPSYVECQTPPQPAFYMPPAQPMGK
jgi:hypothetical protein